MSPISDAHQVFRDMLYEKLRLQAQPLVLGDGFGVPAATLWTGARTWVNRFRAAGLVAGDRVVLAVPRTPAQIMVTIAAWWEGLTLCPVAPREADEPDRLLEVFDASLLIADAEGAHVLPPDSAGDAGERSVRAREAGAPSAGIALIMTTSGSTGTPTRVALSYANVLHHLNSHTAALDVGPEDRVFSVLPWNHAFGMLVDLWPALLSGALIIVDPLDGRSPEATLSAIHEHDITWMSMVPLQASSLADLPGGVAALGSLCGGIVGGAPLSSRLAGLLGRTRLRPGYGQTEASPGITLGRSGVFFEGALGSPLGCETRIVDGELQIKGPNVCAGFWRDGGLVREPLDRWLATGDLVEARPDGLRFVGRRDHRFKLDNGRMIDAPTLERAVEGVLPVGEVVLSPADGRGIHAVVVVPGDALAGVDVDDLVATGLGRECRLLAGVSVVADGPGIRTRKGEIDRRALLRAVGCDGPMTRLAA